MYVKQFRLVDVIFCLCRLFSGFEFEVLEGLRRLRRENFEHRSFWYSVSHVVGGGALIVPKG